jgi:sugar O-acyltransferase (sialic acid O-acetyltransferase NeuD family)
MIIIGAKGFAKQLVEIFFQQKRTEGLFFFDDVSSDVPDAIFGIPVLRSKNDVKDLFASGLKEFCLGLGTPRNRKILANDFKMLGGQLVSVISEQAQIASQVKYIGEGVTFLPGVIVENDVTIQDGVLLNSLCSIHHDSVVESYSEISPGARVLGNCYIGHECLIGTNAVILPKLSVNDGAIVGAGAVVTRDVPGQSMVMGVPANPSKTIK